MSSLNWGSGNVLGGLSSSETSLPIALVFSPMRAEPLTPEPVHLTEVRNLGGVAYEQI